MNMCKIVRIKLYIAEIMNSSMNVNIMVEKEHKNNLSFRI